MQNVKNILMDLDSNYPDWEQNLQENSDFSAYEDAELGHRMLDLVFSFKELCKKRESCSLDIFTELVRERKTAEILQGKVERVLIYYKAFRPIREMFSKDPEAVMELFKDIFFNYVLRFDPNITQRYQIKDGENENAFEGILHAFDNLTDYYVKRLYVQEAVERDFCEETGLSKECGELYANLYEEHFQELKWNLILYGLGECQAQLRQIEDFM